MKAKLEPVPQGENSGSGLWRNCGFDEQPHHPLLVMHLQTFPELMARIRQWILEEK